MSENVLLAGHKGAKGTSDEERGAELADLNRMESLTVKNRWPNRGWVRGFWVRVGPAQLLDVTI